MRSFDSLVDVAEALRNLARLTGAPFALPAIFGAAWPAGVVTGRVLPAGIEEIVTVTRDGPLIIYRRELPSPERRFAIAHAFSHLLWDLGGRAKGAGRFDRRCEQRADAFALELLAPDRLLWPLIVFWPHDGGDDSDIYADQVDRIATHFHVPTSAIDRRIRELECSTNSPSVSA